MRGLVMYHGLKIIRLKPWSILGLESFSKYRKHVYHNKHLIEVPNSLQISAYRRLPCLYYKEAHKTHNTIKI